MGAWRQPAQQCKHHQGQPSVLHRRSEEVHELVIDYPHSETQYSLLQLEVPSALREQLTVILAQLDRAVEHIDQFQRVVRVAVWETTNGPALDLDRSIDPPPQGPDS
jgi:hypothetical protein